MAGVVEMLDVDEPDDGANNGDDLGQHVAKVVQLLLQRSGLRYLRRDVLVDVANRRVRPFVIVWPESFRRILLNLGNGVRNATAWTRR